MKQKKGQIMGSALALLLAAAGTVQAATVTWTGNAGDGKWVTANNWDTLTVPVGGDYVYIKTSGTVDYQDGDNNVVSRHFFNGGMTFNMTGGYLSDSTSGNTIRTYVGDAGSSATLNLSGGQYNIGHALRVGIGGTAGGDGVVNLDGGYLNITRGSYSAFNGDTAMSLSIGQQNGAVNLINGTLTTRTSVEVGGKGTFNVQGTGTTISIGGHGGDGDGGWYQEAGSILRAGIASDGVSPILINDDDGATGSPKVIFKAGAQLYLGFTGDAIGGSWTLMSWGAASTVTDSGLTLAAGVDSKWSFAITNNSLVVTYPEPKTLSAVLIH